MTSGTRVAGLGVAAIFAACGGEPEPARAPACPPATAPIATAITSDAAAASPPITTSTPHVDREFIRRIALTKAFTYGAPVSPTVTPDGKFVLFLRSAARDRKQSLYELDLAKGQAREVLSPDAALQGPETLTAEERARRERLRVTTSGFTSFELSRDGDRVLLTLSGRPFVLRRSTGKLTMLHPKGSVIDPHFSFDGKRVAYVSDSDVHAISSDDGAEIAITRGGTEAKPHGVAELIAQEELDRDRGFWWSPDGTQLLYEASDATKVETHTLADLAHPENPADRSAYPRAGTANADVQLGFVGSSGGATTWVTWDRKTYPYVAQVTWEESGPPAMFVLDRLQKNGQLLAIDRKTGQTRLLLAEHDDAWIDVDASAPRFLSDGRFLWTSERTGKKSLSLHSPKGDVLWTAAPFTVDIADVDEKGKRVLVHTSIEPTENVLTSVTLDSGETALAFAVPHGATYARFSPGRHDVYVSRETSLDAAPHTIVRRLGDLAQGVMLPSVAEDPGPLPKVTIEQSAPDDTRVAILRPRTFDPKRRYPVIDSAYGGPGHAMVTASAMRYVREQWLADATDAIVVVLDAKGTPRRDRAWSRALAGKIGDVPLGGHIATLEALGRTHPEIDLAHAGVFGWSFGGYFSGLAALTRPDFFAVAVAGAPVTDWRDYDTAYTERYLGLPDVDKAAYDGSSLLEIAKRPNGSASAPLLLIHGTADDNVHFAQTLKLADAMERAGKKFELMPLSGITHQPHQPELAEAMWVRIAEFLHTGLVRPRDSK